MKRLDRAFLTIGRPVDALLDLLAAYPQANDLVTEILTPSLSRQRVHAYVHDGYWEDLGSIKTYFEANLALTSDHPPFDFHAEDGHVLGSLCIVDTRWPRAGAGRQAWCYTFSLIELT